LPDAASWAVMSQAGLPDPRRSTVVPQDGIEVPLADKVAFLAAPASHAERPGRVEVVETHMSIVFLTERLAYKLKRPVSLAHLDLRRLPARRRNCEIELQLNRRLAPDVYLAVQPLTFAPSRGLQIGGAGAAVDWLVVMRRLPAQLMLDYALRHGGPERRDLDRVARRLARFHAGLAPEPLAPDTRRAWLEAEIELSCRELARPPFALEHERSERVAGRLIHALRGWPELFAARRIVEGHGDLRPEHIGLEREPVIIDCLEFSRRLRLVDPADELAFLALECRMAGEPEAGHRLQRSYEELSRDRPPERLLAWYAAYRALLRARLVALHALDPGRHTPEVWLARADRYLEVAQAHSDAFA
jgi:uncharacterized protein